MGTLWTPGGERDVPPADEPKQTPPPASPAGVPGAAPAGAPTGDGQQDPLRAAAEAIGVDLDSLNDEEKEQLRAELEEMMAVRRQVAATPAAEMLANHMMRLFDLATIYLETQPPAFSEAATVIEAFRAVVEGLGNRLGEHEPMLTEALGQLQMVFVQVKNANEGEAPD